MVRRHLVSMGISILVTLGVTRASWCQQQPVYEVDRNNSFTRVDSPLSGQKIKRTHIITHQTDHIVKVTKKREDNRDFVVMMETSNNAKYPMPLHVEQTMADGARWQVGESHPRGWVDWSTTFQALICGVFTANASTYFQDPSGGIRDLVGNDTHTFEVVP